MSAHLLPRRACGRAVGAVARARGLARPANDRLSVYSVCALSMTSICLSITICSPFGMVYCNKRAME